MVKQLLFELTAESGDPSLWFWLPRFREGRPIYDNAHICEEARLVMAPVRNNAKFQEAGQLVMAIVLDYLEAGASGHGSGQHVAHLLDGFSLQTGDVSRLKGRWYEHDFSPFIRQRARCNEQRAG